MASSTAGSRAAVGAEAPAPAAAGPGQQDPLTESAALQVGQQPDAGTEQEGGAAGVHRGVPRAAGMPWQVDGQGRPGGNGSA